MIQMGTILKVADNSGAKRIACIKHAFHILFQSKLRFEEACTRVEAECGDSAEVAHLLAFLRASDRGFIR